MVSFQSKHNGYPVWLENDWVLDEGWETKWSEGLLLEFSLQFLEERDVLKQ